MSRDRRANLTRNWGTCLELEPPPRAGPPQQQRPRARAAAVSRSSSSPPTLEFILLGIFWNWF